MESGDQCFCRKGRTLLVITIELMVREAATMGGSVEVGWVCQELSRVLRKSLACVSHDSLSWTPSDDAVVLS